MHRIAIGDPQCVRHQPFAKLRIWMLDGETVWQELYPRGCGSLGLTGCGHCRCLVEVWNSVHVDISSGTRMASARGSATRRRSFPVRAGTTSMVGIFGLIAPDSPSGRAVSGQNLRDVAIMPVICPTCQKFLLAKASTPAPHC